LLCFDPLCDRGEVEFPAAHHQPFSELILNTALVCFYLQMLRREFSRVAKGSARAIDILGKLMTSENEAIYRDELRTKNEAFQDAVSSYLDVRRSQARLSQYLDIIGSPQLASANGTADESEFNFMESQGLDTSFEC
jgi:hypothetical protein